MNKHRPRSTLKGPSFAGIKTFMRLPQVETMDDLDYGIIGIPFDTASTNGIGSRFGPAAIRDVSVSLRQYNSDLDVDIAELLSGADLGDINIIPGYINESHKEIEDFLVPLIKKGIIPVILGGDHSITLPELRSVSNQYGPISLIQFDAHMDTMDSYLHQKYSHATTFRRAWEENLIDTAASVQIGIRSIGKDYTDIGFEVFTADAVRELGINAVAEKVKKRVNGRKVFLTFDIDFVDPAYAPGSGTLEVGGFSSNEVLCFLKLLSGLDFVGFDLVEVLPANDPTKITALLAARIVNQFLGLIAIKKRRSR